MNQPPIIQQRFPLASHREEEMYRLLSAQRLSAQECGLFALVRGRNGKSGGGNAD